MYTKKTKRRIYVIYLEKFSLIGFIIIIFFFKKSKSTGSSIGWVMNRVRFLFVLDVSEIGSDFFYLICFDFIKPNKKQIPIELGDIKIMRVGSEEIVSSHNHHLVLWTPMLFRSFLSILIIKFIDFHCFWHLGTIKIETLTIFAIWVLPFLALRCCPVWFHIELILQPLLQYLKFPIFHVLDKYA